MIIIPYKFNTLVLLSACIVLLLVPDSVLNVGVGSLSILDGLQFVHCQDEYARVVLKSDEQIQLKWILEQKQCFGTELKEFSMAKRYFIELYKKINVWNENLRAVKEAVLSSNVKACGTDLTCARNRKCYQSRLLNAIWMVYRAQNITIAKYFLEKFLNNIKQQFLGELIRNLEKQGKVFDMNRYEKKLDAYKSDLESIKAQLEEKFTYFNGKVLGGKKKKPEKVYAIEYTHKDYANTIGKISEELEKVTLEWTQKEVPDSNQFWTELRYYLNGLFLSSSDNRPIVRQTIWLVRHAEREDNVNEEWCEDKTKAEKENSPLSKRGLKQQSVELSEWFNWVKVDKVFASPYDRCLDTATGLIGTKRGVFINLEPGLAEFHSQSNILYNFVKPSESEKTFSLIDPNYLPVFNQRMLKMMEQEREERKKIENTRDANDHDFVTLQTIRHILHNNEKAKNIVLVTHMGNIGLLLELFGAEWAAVGQASITKLVKYDGNLGKQLSEDVLGHFSLEYASGVTHLKEHTNLRPQ